MHDEDHHQGKDLEELGVETHQDEVVLSQFEQTSEKPLILPQMFSLSLTQA
jgi:hypothetical protein